MKLRNILLEIGDSSAIPPAASFKMDKYEGTVSFNFLGDKYKIFIKFAYNEIAMDSGKRVAIVVDFFANNDKDAVMTNRGQAIKTMSYVVGCLEEWLKRYKDKFGEIELVYIKFNPKSESSEEKGDETVNKRDKLYRAYIDKFARKYGSRVNYTVSGGVVSKFEPNISIK
jgi:hypothetical protein